MNAMCVGLLREARPDPSCGAWSRRCCSSAVGGPDCRSRWHARSQLCFGRLTEKSGSGDPGYRLAILFTEKLLLKAGSFEGLVTLLVYCGDSGHGCAGLTEQFGRDGGARGGVGMEIDAGLVPTHEEE